MKAGVVYKVLASFVLIVLLWLFVSNRSIKEASVFEVSRGIAVDAVPGTVHVLAEKEITLRGEHGGRVLHSRLAAGDLVSQGQAIVALDTDDLELLIEDVERDYRHLEERMRIGSPLRLELEAREDALADVQHQFERKGATEREVKEARRAVQITREQLAREDLNDEVQLQKLENRREALQRQKEGMTIHSPMDGMVVHVFAHEGELLAAGEPVAMVVSVARVVEVKVSEEHFAGLEPGLAARVVFLGIGDERFDARIERVIPVADPKTQRFTIRLEVEIDQQRLASGFTGDAVITLDEREDTLLVPRAAIIDGTAWVVADGFVERRSVEIGYASVTTMEILDGLTEGEQVIVEDLHLFQTGDRVRAVLKQ